MSNPTSLRFKYLDDNVIKEGESRLAWTAVPLSDRIKHIWVFDCTEGSLVIQIHENFGKWYITTTISVGSMVQSNYTLAHQRSKVDEHINNHVHWFEQGFNTTI